MNKILEIKPTTDADFLQDVIFGLSQTQKSIPCKWFYDEAGSLLFEAITKTKEYYPTRVETRLLKQVVAEVAKILPKLSLVVEPGSGASIKTRILLSSQPQLSAYIPMDISEDFLNSIAQQLHQDFPQIQTIPVVGDFTNISMPLELESHAQRLVFFPGSTIGNFSPSEALRLLKNFHYLSGNDGWLLIGVDSTQNQEQLTAAYNDKEGVTARFNKNLLLRVNRELSANFIHEQFVHEAIFNQVEGRVEMHLVSLCQQTVSLAGYQFQFEVGETIFTENCYKYTRKQFLDIANACDWQMGYAWQDQVESGFELFLLKSSFT